ncbi:MAG: hypothetical protein IPN76_29230 [Saprospiraceae bacterium]|nr:hypothetical protein [Saprospiraceae bacterium]
MKNASHILRNVSALVLTGIYVAFWAWMSLHHFVLHDHHHHGQKTCYHAPTEKHLHSEEYGGLDCSLCHIVPSLAEPPVLSGLLLQLPELVQCPPVFGDRILCSASPHTLSQPRAPPVRPA